MTVALCYGWLTENKTMLFRNYYECDRCDTEWADEWSCCCDDRCPTCNLSCSPTRSEVVEDDGAEPKC